MAGEGLGFNGHVKAELCQGLPNAGPLSRADVAEQQILVGGQPDLQLIGLHDLAQALFHGPFQATTHQRQSDEPQTSFLAVPAEVIEQFGFGLIAQALEVSFEVIPLQCVAEPLDALVVEQVLHPRVFAHLPVAVVTLQGEDRLHHIENISGLHVSEGISGAGEGLLLVVSSSHATAHVDVAAPQASGGVREGHQADVLGQQIHGVVTRHRDSNLELSRQVGVAVEGLIAAAREHSAL